MREKPLKTSMSGNAMIYILLALALLAGLTMVLSRGNDQAGDTLSSDQAELLTTRMTAYAGVAKNAVDQMMMSGTNINNLSFLRPNQDSFDDAPFINKLHHPEGGGLSLDSADDNLFTGAGTEPPPGWYIGRFNNIEWTPTTANDIVLAAHDISQAVCASINKKITGSTDIPALAGTGDPATYFIDSAINGPLDVGTGQPTAGVANADLTIVECADCEGYPSLCVSGNAATQWTYYSIISGQ